ncbi:MAG: S1 RNA-binding domain-containing protein [Bacteroidetes bacterium]|nr:S1 RNA-binding domain-containing protein [Bacteroidota bacterium]
MTGKIIKINSNIGVIEYDTSKRITYKINAYGGFKFGDVVSFKIERQTVLGTEHTFDRASNLKLKEAGSRNFIRLNKILRELNIPLKTAVQFFSEHNIPIESRPTAKLSIEHSELILSHFIKKKMDEGSSSIPKPELILEEGIEVEAKIVQVVHPSLLIVEIFDNTKAILPLQNLSWNFFTSQQFLASSKINEKIKVQVLSVKEGNEIIVSRKHLINRPVETSKWQKLKIGQKLSATVKEILINKIIVETEIGFYGVINISSDQRSSMQLGQTLNVFLVRKDDITQFLKLNIYEETEVQIEEDESFSIIDDFQTQDQDLKSIINFKRSVYYTVASKTDKENIINWFENDGRLFSSAIYLDSPLIVKFGFNTQAWENDFKNSLLPYIGENANEKEGLKFLESQKYWIRTNTRVDQNEGQIKHDWVLFNEKVYLSGSVFQEELEYNFVIFSLSLGRTKKYHSLDKANSSNRGTFLLNSKVKFLSPNGPFPLDLHQGRNFLKIQSKVLAFETLNRLKLESGAILREEGLSITIFDKFLEYQIESTRKGVGATRVHIDGYNQIPNTRTSLAIEINQDLEDLFGGTDDDNQLVSLRTIQDSFKEELEEEFVWYCDSYVELNNGSTKLHLINLEKPLDLLDHGFYIERKVSLTQFQVQRDVIRDFLDKKLKLDHIESLLVRPEKIKPPRALEFEFYNDVLSDTEKNQPKNNQVNSVKKAVGNENIFLIQGPPGTGKTTVIAEVAEQLVTRGEKVLVSSQTHIAVDNVLEKVSQNKKLTCIRLGNEQRVKDNLKQFQINNLIDVYSEDFEKLISINESLVDYLIEKGENVDFDLIRQELKTIVQGESSKYQDNFRDIILTKNYEFLELLSNTPFQNLNKIKSLLSEWKANLSHEKELLIKPLLYKSTDIVFATCIGVRTDKELNDSNIKFDTVIIDEAGKANISETLAAISMAKKVILVGDQMQLPPYIDGSLLDEMLPESFPRSKYGNKFLKEDVQHALKTSFFEFLVNRIKIKKFPGENKELLNYQHRMHPHIGEFISESFYDGKVKMGEHTYKNTLSLPSPFEKEIVFINTSTAQFPYESFDGFSAQNNAEAYCISELIIPKLTESGLTPKEFAIVAPYKSQVKHIKKYLSHKVDNSHLIEVSTLDSFQGMEFDVIVFSFTRSASPEQTNKKVGFLDDARRLNVAFSRAKKKLILVGNSETLTDSRSHFDSLYPYTELFKRLVNLSKNDEIGSFVELTDYADLKSPIELFSEKHKVGSIVDGTIKSVTNYGAFVNMGSIDGLIYIADLSWEKVNHPQEIVEVGEEVRVKILKYDFDKKQVSLGYKQLLPNPWKSLTYEVGDKVVGSVVKIFEFGLLLQLPHGIDGLLHYSEMRLGDTKNVSTDAFKKNDEIEVVIVSIDASKCKIALSRKPILTEIWSKIKSKYILNNIYEAKMIHKTKFGIILELEVGLEGLLHKSKLGRGQKIDEIFRKYEPLQVKIEAIDISKRKISFGRKPLAVDPWTNIKSKYILNNTYEAKMTHKAKFGIFLELEDGLEGLLHKSKLGRGQTIDDVFREYEPLQVKIEAIDMIKKQISFINSKI